MQIKNSAPYRAVSPICLRLGNVHKRVQALQTISPNAKFIETLYKMQNEVSYPNIMSEFIKTGLKRYRSPFSSSVMIHRYTYIFNRYSLKSMINSLSNETKTVDFL